MITQKFAGFAEKWNTEYSGQNGGQQRQGTQYLWPDAQRVLDFWKTQSLF